MSEQSPSESPGQGPAEPTGQPGRYQRSAAGLVGAMILLFVVAASCVGLQTWRTGDQGDPAKAVTYLPAVKQARADGELAPAPSPLPKGWKVTSVRYAGGSSPRWHLGMLTDSKEYVGIEQARVDVADLVDRSLGEAGRSSGSTTIDGRSWRRWTTAKGDRALTTMVDSGARGSVVLVGGTGSFTDLTTAIDRITLSGS